MQTQHQGRASRLLMPASKIKKDNREKLSMQTFWQWKQWFQISLNIAIFGPISPPSAVTFKNLILNVDTVWDPPW